MFTKVSLDLIQGEKIYSINVKFDESVEEISTKKMAGYLTARLFTKLNLFTKKPINIGRKCLVKLSIEGNDMFAQFIDSEQDNEIFSKKTGHWASDEKEFAQWLLERLNAAAMPNGNTFEKCVSPERGE